MYDTGMSSRYDVTGLFIRAQINFKQLLQQPHIKYNHQHYSSLPNQSHINNNLVLYNPMIKQKQQQWQRTIRKQQIQTMKQACRERKKMMEELEYIIDNLSQCSLYLGNEELLAHKCFFDCEAFAISMHQRLFMIIVKIGTEWCKRLIIDKNLPGILYRVAITIENKIIQPQQNELNKQFYSRQKVLNSISRILCIFTQDNDLIGEHGQFLSSMLITSIKYQSFLNSDDTHKDHLIALLNLFYYDLHQQSAYNQLRNINFQLIFQRYLLAIVDNRINPGDVDINHFKLFRKYTKYQIDFTDDEMSRRMLMNMADFLIYIFDEEKKDFLGIFRSEVVQEILKICTLLNFKGEICLAVLKNTQVYSYLAYSELLNTWSYNNSFISVDDFTCTQLVEILQALNRTEKTSEAIHAQKLAASLTNLLYNGHLDGESISKVRRCLKESQTYDILCDSQREQQGFIELCKVMSTISQDDI